MCNEDKGEICQRIQSAKSADNGVRPRCTRTGESYGASTGEGRTPAGTGGTAPGDTGHITGQRGAAQREQVSRRDSQGDEVRESQGTEHF